MRAKLLILLLILVLALSSVRLVYAQEVLEDFLFDVVVTYTSADGWEIVAKDGWQVTGDLKVIVYTNQPGVVSITAVIENEKVLDVKESIEFKKEYKLSIPRSKYGKVITFTIVMTWGRISKTITKSYTIVKAPVAPKTSMINWLSPKQWKRLLESVKWETITFALFVSLAGIGFAVFLKYKAMMLEPINALQLPGMAAALLALYFIDPEYFAGYFMIWLLADFLSYKFLKGPNLVGILELRMKDREIWDVMLPVYVTESGRLAIALQRSDWAIRRLLGKHVYLELKGNPKELWKKNGGYDCIIAESTQLKQKEITFHTPEEATEGLELKKERKKEWVFEVEVADAHTLHFIKKVSYFDKLKKAAKQAFEEVTFLRETLGIERAKAKAEALYELDQLLSSVGGGEGAQG